MSFWGGLAAFGQGMQQGEQNKQALQMKAAQIQQFQMQLDAAKKDLSARAAMFNNMGPSAQPFGADPSSGGGGAPPAGPSGPAGPAPAPAPAGPQMGPQMAPQMGPQVRPQIAPQAGPQAGPQAAPQAGPQAGPGGQPPGGQGGDQFDPFSQVMNIAKQIKARNPGIDPVTLSYAVGDTIDMMKGLAPDMRAQMQYMAGIMRDQTQRDIAAGKNQTQITVQGMRDTTSERNVDRRIGASLQENRDRIDASMQRLQYAQNEIDKRAVDKNFTQARKSAYQARARTLKQKLAEAKQRLTDLQSSTDDKAVADAQKQVEGLQSELTRFYQLWQKDSGQGASGGAGSKTIDFSALPQ